MSWWIIYLIIVGIGCAIGSILAFFDWILEEKCHAYFGELPCDKYAGHRGWHTHKIHNGCISWKEV